MPLAELPQLLEAARAGGYALGYFEAWDGYSLQAVLEAAEAERAPVITGFGCLLEDQPWLDNGGIETHGALGRAAAERATVPVALLLNEARRLEHARRGVEAGFTAVMPAVGTADEIAGLVRFAHEHGVAVEAELGSLPGAGREPGAPTDPDEAAAYVAATGIDCLAVSFGNEHLLEGRHAHLDLDRLAAIRERVPVPLAAHGGTGFPADAVPAAIERGIAKLNVGTVLKRSYLGGLTDAVAALPTTVTASGLHDAVGSHLPQDLLAQAAGRIVPVVRGLIRLYGGSGRAA